MGLHVVAQNKKKAQSLSALGVVVGGSQNHFFLVAVQSGGGGGSRKSDILLETPPNLKKGGFWGGCFRRFFAVLGHCPREGHPGPPKPPPNP